MTMKENHDGVEPVEEILNTGTGKTFKIPQIRPGPAIATGLAFLVSTVLILHNNYFNGNSRGGNIQDFEVGKAAEQSVSYIDEINTQLKFEARRHLVLPVFTYFPRVNTEVQKNYTRFEASSLAFFGERLSLEAYRLRISAEFPGFFSEEMLGGLFQAPNRNEILDLGASLLEHFMEKGIFLIPESGLEAYNPDMVEVLRSSGSQTGRERVNFSQIVTLDTLRDAIDQYATEGFPPSFRLIAFDILRPFIKENVFFSPQDTKQRLDEAAAHMESMVKNIEPGKQIIRKESIVTEEDMAQLKAMNAPSQKDSRIIIGQFLILLLIYGFFVFLGSLRLIGRALINSEIYLLSVLTALYIVGAAFAKNLSFNIPFFPVSILLPTALAVMLLSILISAPIALVWAMVLPLGAFLSGSFDVSAYMFALVSGVVGSYALQGAEKRMDLVKAGLIIAGANGIAVIALLLINGAGWKDYPAILFWAAFNGVASGMLVLGLLPPLEHALNAATTFRLIELSDLNAPLLKRLFTVASGTYSHSIMVANLAEAACRKIGANPLLARVGAYYHDIGKMEQSDYFVENQTSYNKHNDISPSLSATIIRSHVRIGVEKARILGLPREVANIVAEHHGNSVITWFYNKAMEEDPQAVPEDFSYPGIPPRSRESAVVMLADVSEAAVRTLENPTSDKIDHFLQELINAKVEHGQLAASELTFRDLETIKHAFVQVLAGYYHSRIKYPKLPKELPPPDTGNSP